MTPVPYRFALLVSAIALGWSLPGRAQATIGWGDPVPGPGSVGATRTSEPWLKHVASMEPPRDADAGAGDVLDEEAFAALGGGHGNAVPVLMPSVEMKASSTTPVAWFEPPALRAASPSELTSAGPADAVVTPSSSPALSDSAQDATALEVRSARHAAVAVSSDDHRAPITNQVAAQGEPPSAARSASPTAAALAGASSEVAAWELFVAGAAASAEGQRRLHGAAGREMRVPTADVPTDGRAAPASPHGSPTGQQFTTEQPREAAGREGAPTLGQAGREPVDAPSAIATPGPSRQGLEDSTPAAGRRSPISPRGPIAAVSVERDDAAASRVEAVAPRGAGVREATPTADEALALYERAQRSVLGTVRASAGLPPLSAPGAVEVASRPGDAVVSTGSPLAVQPAAGRDRVSPGLGQDVDTMPLARPFRRAEPAAAAPSPAVAAAGAGASQARLASSAAGDDIVVADHASRVLMGLELLLDCSRPWEERFGVQARQVVVASHSEKVMRTLQDVLSQAKARRALEKRHHAAVPDLPRANARAVEAGPCERPTAPGESARDVAVDVLLDFDASATPAPLDRDALPQERIASSSTQAAGHRRPSGEPAAAISAADAPCGSPVAERAVPSEAVVDAAARCDVDGAQVQGKRVESVAFAGRRPVLAASELDAVRGGFTTDSGLKISFGIQRAVYVNGSLVTTTSLSVSDLGRISGGQAALPPSGSEAMMLVQNGNGNVARLGDVSGALGTIVQNSLNGQNISNVTVINATVNSLRLSRAIDLHTTLRNAMTDSLRR